MTTKNTDKRDTVLGVLLFVTISTLLYAPRLWTAGWSSKVQVIVLGAAFLAMLLALLLTWILRNSETWNTALEDQIEPERSPPPKSVLRRTLSLLMWLFVILASCALLMLLGDLYVSMSHEAQSDVVMTGAIGLMTLSFIGLIIMDWLPRLRIWLGKSNDRANPSDSAIPGM